MFCDSKESLLKYLYQCGKILLALIVLIFLGKCFCGKIVKVLGIKTFLLVQVVLQIFLNTKMQFF